MSLFWTFYGEADIPADDLVQLVADITGGAVSAPRTVLAEGMDATVLMRDDDSTTAEDFGFTERSSVVFNLHNLASPEVRAHNEASIVEVVLRVFETRPGRGLLLFYGNRVVLQRLTAHIEFADDWAEWLDPAEVQPIVAEHATAHVAQPWA